MHLYLLPLAFALAGLAIYTALGGADFGAGFWQIVATDDDISDEAHHAMAPVWEANHVWLIFVLTVFWTAYPLAFGSIASTLAVPLFLALLGLVFRGAAYALRAGATTPHESGRIDTIFSLSSIVCADASALAAEFDREAHLLGERLVQHVPVWQRIAPELLAPARVWELRARSSDRLRSSVR